ncbi:MAG: hypothetical protein E6Q33_04890 [Neisseriales bacterium]|nr:MAG: hypothetical protein E6Q33_04890 [Neisseriales bacterium]
MKNYYRILGLSIDAEYEEIRAAYKILAQQHHPDKGGSQTEFTLIQEAYTILSDPKTKRVYDNDLLKYISDRQLSTVARSSGNGSSMWLWLMGIFTCAALAFAYWAYQQHKEQETIINALKKPINTTSSAPIATTPKKARRKAVTPSAKKTNTSNPTATAATNNNDYNQLNGYSGTLYLINTGSFSDLNTAKARQKQLTQFGFSSKIQKINANTEGDTSYNVFIGPYQTLDNANKTLDALNKQNIDATLEQVVSE